MKKLLLPLAVIALTILQLAWPGFLNFFNSKPDFLLVFAVSLVFYLDFKIAFVLAVMAGLAKDLFLPGNIAINTLTFSGWSFLIHRLSTQISTDDKYVRIFIVLIAAFLNNLMIGLVISNSGNNIPAIILLRNLIIPSVYSALISPLIFKLIENSA